MREILFRGKAANGTWIMGDLLHDGLDYETAIWEKGTKSVIGVRPETVGQFTGLTDKNGKKIFEGDIVWHHLEEEDAVILFFEGGFIVNFFKSGGIDDLRENSRYLEVTSNIHDNPELLGGD